MTTIKIPATAARSLAIVALTSYNKILKGLPSSPSEDDLGECMHVVQHGFWPTKVLATEADRKKCHGILTEENMRRGLGKCIERVERLIGFFGYMQKLDLSTPAEVELSFDDYVLLKHADEVTAEDFK